MMDFILCVLLVGIGMALGWNLRTWLDNAYIDDTGELCNRE